MIRALDNLLKESFSDILACLPSPSAVRDYLARSAEVLDLRQSLKTGELTEGQIREFVGELMGDFKRGDRFTHEGALCAISVALERRETGFSDEYTKDLAKLKLAELSTAIRVARLSLAARSRLAKNEASVFVHSVPVTGVVLWHPVRRRRVGTDEKHRVMC